MTGLDGRTEGQNGPVEERTDTINGRVELKQNALFGGRTSPFEGRASLTVLYGSQTGTAQDTAERVTRVLVRDRFDVKVKPMDDYDITKLAEEDLVIFVCSTTGQGEEPDNMKRFWRFLLRRSLPPDALEGVAIGVLGLGDSSYPKFNFVAKRLFKRLQQLGAETLVTLGLADDQHDLGIDATIVPWIKALRQALDTAFPMPEGLEPLKEGCLLPSKYGVMWEEADVDADSVHVSNGLSTTPSATTPFSAAVIGNERITADDHWQDVRKISFDISGSNIRYDPGDVLMIRPCNSDKSVDTFFELFPHLDPNRKFRLVAADANTALPMFLPTPCTIHWAVKRFLDVNAIPRLYFWELLAAFTDDENEKEKLDEFLTPEGTQDLWDYCNRVRRNCLEVLHDFPFATRRIPFEYLFDLMTPLQPRAFSIASAQAKHGDTLEILMAVVRYKTKLFEPRLGVCSNWLASLDPQVDSDRSKALIWTRGGTMSFPATATPMILIGPGTGVAPFRSLIHHRAATVKASSDCLLFLFFGCRHQSKDFYCATEWSDLEARGLLKLFPAFSRDQEEKIYVQDLILAESQLVWDLINDRGAFVCLAGNAKRMPEDVWAILRKVVMRHSELVKTETDAEEFLKKLERDGRYQTETWS